MTFYLSSGAKTEDVELWARDVERNKRVGLDFLPYGSRHLCVSTVFLGIDHGLLGGQPLLYETMIFEADAKGVVTNWSELYCKRYPTLDAAEDGHEYIVTKLKTCQAPGVDVDKLADDILATLQKETE